MIGSTSSWAGERLKYDDAWWAAQYDKIYDTPHCQEIITNIDIGREFDREFGTLNTPFIWAFSLYFAKRECVDPAPDQALAIFTDLAERGHDLAALYLAHFHDIKYGADAPSTQSWMKRAKNAMPLIISKTWRKDFYQPVADTYKKMGIPFSPQLDGIFSWGEKILNGDPQHIYEYGIALLEHGKNPEDKVLGCNWLYAAESKGHKQARLRFAQLHILGKDIVQDLSTAKSWLDISVNKDKNTEALIYLARLLEQGDIFKQDLQDAYSALLRAESFGADVKPQLAQLRTKLSDSSISTAEWLAARETASITFTVADALKRPHKSRAASRICGFLP